MAYKEYKRPNPAVMQNILQKNQKKIVEIALRLAWSLGLSRDEMYYLKWSDISFEEKVITLPDRKVPMDDETALCLEYRRNSPRGARSEYVMASDRNHTHMAKEHLSRIIRVALDEGGLRNITSIDLRQDCVIRMLETHDWPYVSRVTGMSLSTLYTNYSDYPKNNGGAAKESPCDTNDTDYESKIWKIIEAEGTSVAGLALWMVFELEMKPREVAALTWDQVDLENGCITLPDRTLQVCAELLKNLESVKEERGPDADSHVILSPKAQTPYDMPRLSKTLRDALIRGGVDITLKDVLLREKEREEDAELLEFIAQNAPVTRNEIMKHYSLTQMQTFNRVHRLIEKGRVVSIGTKVYLAGTVVPPEEHYEVIRAHLENMGAAYSSELAGLLVIGNSQCAWILKRLVNEGKLNQIKKMYSLPN